MSVMAAMLIGAAIFTYWVRSALAGGSFSIALVASTHDVVSVSFPPLLTSVGRARVGETHARGRSWPASHAPRAKDHHIRRNRERANSMSMSHGGDGLIGRFWSYRCKVITKDGSTNQVIICAWWIL
jgi:hypothetical protein